VAVIQCTIDYLHLGLDWRKVNAFNLLLVRSVVAMSLEDILYTLESRVLPMVSNCRRARNNMNIPISEHHAPVPQPMSSIRFGFFDFSGAK
jgi:hypothetical protein